MVRIFTVGRLAGAVRAQQAEHAAGLGDQAHAVEGAHAAAVGLHQPGGLNRCVHGFVLPATHGAHSAGCSRHPRRRQRWRHSRGHIVRLSNDLCVVLSQQRRTPRRRAAARRAGGETPADGRNDGHRRLGPLQTDRRGHRGVRAAAAGGGHARRGRRRAGRPQPHRPALPGHHLPARPAHGRRAGRGERADARGDHHGPGPHGARRLRQPRGRPGRPAARAGRLHGRSPGGRRPAVRRGGGGEQRRARGAQRRGARA